jgi:transposase
MSTYSLEYKRSLALKALESPNFSVDQIAKEAGVSRASLFRWVNQFGPMSAGIIKRKIVPKQWSMAQRIRALLETQNMSDYELGVYLREHGLYFTTLIEWKAEILEEVTKKDKSGVPKGESNYLRRIRELERELKQKEKALKEATALLALKKKAELIWGVVEDEKLETPTEKPAKTLSKKRSKKGAD